jgi:diguanylate cyclase (GGDEF)-like protein
MKFGELPVAARFYVLAIIAGGAVATVDAMSAGAFDRPLFLVTFVAASIVVHSMKVTVPVGGSNTTLSLGFAVTFASLLVLGERATVWTTLAGAWAQSTLNTKSPNPWYRVVFTMSALALSIEAAARMLVWTGGANLDGPADIVVPSIAASALVYFAANSTLISTALGLTSGQPIVKIWDQQFLWGAPNYLLGALAATIAVQSVGRYGLQAVALLIAPLYLAYRLYRGYLDRVGSLARTNRELHSLYERAHAESMTDALTELPNRRFLTTHADAELARARREGYEVAVLVVDIDQFKQINDRFGHAEGDLALRTVAAALRNGLRSYDACGRYAGDEFVMILARCGAELAEKRGAELAEALAARLPDSEFPPDRPLSISVGAAVFPGDGARFDELLAVADSRMYARKHRRRQTARSAR